MGFSYINVGWLADSIPVIRTVIVKLSFLSGVGLGRKIYRQWFRIAFSLTLVVDSKKSAKGKTTLSGALNGFVVVKINSFFSSFC